MASLVPPPNSTGTPIDGNSPNTGTFRELVTLGDPTQASAQQTIETLVSNTYAGAAVCIAPTNWTLYNTPASATIATATQSAGSAGVQHVLQGFSVTYVTGSTAASSAVQLQVLDGSTVKYSLTFLPAANSTVNFHVSNLNIVGTAATAMTVAFSGAGPTGSYQSLSAFGYDIN
jgi:hypothetical protein